jgi:hypothetical protein
VQYALDYGRFGAMMNFDHSTVQTDRNGHPAGRMTLWNPAFRKNWSIGLAGLRSRNLLFLIGGQPLACGLPRSPLPVEVALFTNAILFTPALDGLSTAAAFLYDPNPLLQTYFVSHFLYIHEQTPESF